MPINYIDIAISIIFLFFIYRGFSNGFFQELSAVVGLLGGFFLAKEYAPDLATYLNGYVSNSTAHMIAFIIIVMLTLFVASLCARLMTSFFKILFLGWVNRVLGALFGLTKGIFLVCIFIYIITAISSPNSPFLQESIFLPYYSVIIEYIAPFLQTNSIF